MMRKALLFLFAGMVSFAAWGCSGGGSGDSTGVYAGGGTYSNTGVDDDTYALTYTDDYETCMVKDTYDECEITRYVDSR
jgi:hypothetical protein